MLRFVKNVLFGNNKVVVTAPDDDIDTAENSFASSDDDDRIADGDRADDVLVSDDDDDYENDDEAIMLDHDGVEGAYEFYAKQEILKLSQRDDKRLSLQAIALRFGVTMKKLRLRVKQSMSPDLRVKKRGRKAILTNIVLATTFCAVESEENGLTDKGFREAIVFGLKLRRKTLKLRRKRIELS